MGDVYVVYSLDPLAPPLPPIRRQGLCSSYLSERQDRDVIPVFVKQSLFRLPPAAEQQRPVIMVAAGTGVAPFRGFIKVTHTRGVQKHATRLHTLIFTHHHLMHCFLYCLLTHTHTHARAYNFIFQERILRAQSSSSSVRPAPMVLFYGCCHPSIDFLYRDELLQAVRDGHLIIHTAFSHEHAYRRYVQHVMLEPENRAQVWRMIEHEGANVYMCGSLKRLAPAVQEALNIIAMSEGHKTKEEAEEYFKKLQADHRFQMDCF